MTGTAPGGVDMIAIKRINPSTSLNSFDGCKEMSSARPYAVRQISNACAAY